MSASVEIEHRGAFPFPFKFQTDGLTLRGMQNTPGTISVRPMAFSM